MIKVNSALFNLMNRFYNQIERDLKYIINSPSTINRVSYYYKLAYNLSENIAYLLFIYDGVVYFVKMYDLKDFKIKQTSLDLFYELGLNLTEPKPIVGIIGYRSFFY